VLYKDLKKDHPDDIIIRCPSIWIDGHGKIVDVNSSGFGEGESAINSAKTNLTLRSAESTGIYVGVKISVIPRVDGLARNMYLHLE
jgi:hypothetical protein